VYSCHSARHFVFPLSFSQVCYLESGNWISRRSLEGKETGFENANSGASSYRPICLPKLTVAESSTRTTLITEARSAGSPEVLSRLEREESWPRDLYQRNQQTSHKNRKYLRGRGRTIGRNHRRWRSPRGDFSATRLNKAGMARSFP